MIKNLQSYNRDGVFSQVIFLPYDFFFQLVDFQKQIQ